MATKSASRFSYSQNERGRNRELVAYIQQLEARVQATAPDALKMFNVLDVARNHHSGQSAVSAEECKSLMSLRSNRAIGTQSHVGCTIN